MDDKTSQTEPKTRRVTRWAAPLFVVGAVLLLLGLFYVEENWRGEMVWRRTKAQLEARGEILDWKHYLPTPPPDERNMMKVPGMEDTFIKGRTGGLNLSSVPTGNLGRSNHVRYGEIELIAGQNAAPTSLEMLRTNATARRELGRGFAGRGVEAPPGIYLSERKPGVEVKRVPIASDAAVDAKAFQNEDGGLRPLPDRVDRISSNVMALSFQVDRWFGAEDYIAWSASQSNLVAMLDEAAKRPECWLPGDYSVPFASPIPKFVAIRHAAQFLGARAQAFLLLNRPDEAYVDLQRIDTLNRMVRAKPMTLVAAMIHVAVTGLQVSVIADGFAMGAWQERHWRGFIESYSGRELLPPVTESLRSGERAGVLHLVEQLSTEEGRRAADQDSGIKSLDDALRMMPRGWARLNIAYYARTLQSQIDLFDGKMAIDPGSVQRTGEEVVAGVERRFPTRKVAQMALANVQKAGQTALRNQTFIHELMIASALELHRKEHGHYPETLGELSPRFLKKIPNDLIRGQPLKYQRRKNGEYALHSIGWNATDDLAPLLANDDTPMLEILESKAAVEDWVWKGVPEIPAK